MVFSAINNFETNKETKNKKEADVNNLNESIV